MSVDRLVDPAPPRFWTWRRLVAVTLAKAVLVGLLGLAAWGALPAVIGWHPTTVSSGSMLPRLHVGDVAVSRPLGAGVPPLTSVLLFHDPDHPGRLRMHRFVRVDENGLLVTRGDANGSDDSTPVPLGAVIGIGTLRVPWIALPIVWLRGGSWLALGLVAGVLALLLVVATGSRDRVFADEEPPDDADGGPDGPGAPPVDGPPDARPRGRGPRFLRPAPGGAWFVALVRPAHRTGTVRLGVGVVAAVLVAGLASPAGAAFRATTATTGSAAAATYFTCANAVAAASPALWYRMDETSSTATAATDSASGGRTGVYSSAGKTTTTAKACPRDSGRAMTFNGSSGYLSSPSLGQGLPNTFSLSIWFRTTTTTGGKLIGFGTSQTGLSATYDRHLYLTNAGRVVFGVYPNAVKTVTSPAAYNDGTWHLAVATLSSAGMRLYVDGDQVAADTSVTTGEGGTATYYLRVAYDNLDNWDSTPTSRYFSGTLDDAAYYTTALSAAQVRALDEAGSPA